MEYHGSIIRISVPSGVDGTKYLSPAGNLFDGSDGEVNSKRDRFSRHQTAVAGVTSYLSMREA